MNEPLGANAFANLGAVPQASLGASAFSHLGAIPNVAPSPQSSIMSGPQTLNGVVNSPGVQGVLGAGDALRNTISSGLNMLPGVNIAPAKTGSGTAYNVGNIAGNIGGFLGGGEALDTARAASEAAPVIGQLATALGGNGISGIARRALGSAAYSGATNDQNRAENAGIGAGASLASEAIPGIAGKLAQGAQYFMPQRFAQNIIQTLGGGQNLEDATKSVLSSIRNSYQAQKANASDLYNPVFDSVPSGSIYANVGKTEPVASSPTIINKNAPAANSPMTPLMSANAEPVVGGQSTAQKSFSNLTGQYPNLPETITDNYTNTLQKMHNDFINNPTFQNAHELQSELGVQSRYLQDGNAAPSIATSNNVAAINQARDALKSDMMSFLNKQGTPLNPDAAPGVANTELAQQYTNASNNYQQNVVPYLSNPKIASIATGDKTNAVPSTLSTIFAAPNESMSKVIGDLPEDTMNKVLYTKLGQTVPNKSAQGLLNSYQNLQQQGLGAHVSPELASQIGELENRIKARNGLQMATAGLSAAALGGAHGSATAGAMMGLGAGAVASPFMNYISRRLPIDNISAAISNVLRGSYPAGRSAVLANYLNNSGVKNGS
jgi:hypothetical protein